MKIATNLEKVIDERNREKLDRVAKELDGEKYTKILI